MTSGARALSMLRLWALTVVAMVLAQGCGAKPTPGDDGRLPGDGGSSGPVTVTLSLAAGRMVAGEALQVAAVVTGAADTSVRWFVNDVPGGSADVGTIDVTGNHQAPATPPEPPMVTLRGTSMADATASATANVSVVHPAGAGLLARYSTSVPKVR